MAEAAKKESNIVTLKDVIFMYSSVSRPVEQLNTDKKAPQSDSPLEFHSYEIKILISEERFKKLKKAYKGAKNLPNAKEHEKDDLVEKYDFLKDIEDELADDLVLVKFSQSCLVGKPDKDGVRRESFPVKQIGIKAKVQDKNGLTIDQETSLGNGTKGHFQFRPVDNGENGTYLYPHLLCITELVEYTGGEREDDFDSLGLDELDEVDVQEEGKAQADDADEANDAATQAAEDDAASGDNEMF